MDPLVSWYVKCWNLSYPTWSYLWKSSKNMVYNLVAEMSLQDRRTVSADSKEVCWQQSPDTKETAVQSPSLLLPYAHKANTPMLCSNPDTLITPAPILLVQIAHLNYCWSTSLPEVKTTVPICCQDSCSWNCTACLALGPPVLDAKLSLLHHQGITQQNNRQQNRNKLPRSCF